jgi:glycosyltransferase involved in cell wall biosynthesis
MNLISIICSVYNSSKWLDVYLNSVNNQLEKEFEIIFIDANSTDSSISIIENFKFRNGIKYKIIKNSERISIYKAWNMGIKECLGEYVMNWNTDDLLYPSALVIYSEYFKQNPFVDLFYSPCCIINSQSYDSVIGFRNWPEHSHELLLKFCYCGPFPLVKKSAIQSVGYFNENYKSSGDYDMWLKLSKSGFKFKKIPDIIGSFYQRQDSVSVGGISLAQAEDQEIQNNYK